MKNRSLEEVKLIIMDVDGTLTDGKIIIDNNGVEYKNFSVKDGMGISKARKNGLKTAIITGRVSNVVEIRSKELGIDFVYQGINNKKLILETLIEDLELKSFEVAYIGDDDNDAEVLAYLENSFAVNNASKLAKTSANFVLDSNGGDGAVREMIEYILEVKSYGVKL